MKVYFIFCFIFTISLVRGDLEVKEQKEAEEFHYNGYILQDDYFLTTKNYLTSNPNVVPSLSQFSVCMRFYQRGTNPLMNTLMNYISEEGEDFNIHTNGAEKVLEILCCQTTVRIKFPIENMLWGWNSFCANIDFINKKVYVALNGKISHGELSQNTPNLLKTGGKITIGQDYDGVVQEEGEIKQLFDGTIVDFLLFPEYLSESYAIDYSLCKRGNERPGILFAFQDAAYNMTPVGNVTNVTVSSKEVCGGQEYVLLIPQKSTFFQAERICSSLKGQLVNPKSVNGTYKPHTEFAIFESSCLDFWNALFWVGFVANPALTKWVNYIDKSELLHPEVLLEGYDTPQNKYRCLSSGSKIHAFKWFATDCEYLSCPLCEFKELKLLTLRGLCEQTNIDIHYAVRGYKNDRPLLRGTLNTRIYWHNETWVLLNGNDKEVQGVMTSKGTNFLPLGLRKWKILGNRCGTVENTLLLTACNDREVTCHNEGNCIGISKRCDAVSDCQDSSDEMDCDAVIIPAEYSTELPPPMTNKTTLKSLAISFQITSVRQFNLVGFRLGIDVVISLKWTDSRLKYRNLKVDSSLNKIHNASQVWQPVLYIEDGVLSPAEIKLKFQTFTLQKLGEFSKGGPEKIVEDYLYEGNETMIIQKQKIVLYFSCQFELQMYPFDYQRCSFITTILDASHQLQLVQDDLPILFRGQRNLLEYQLAKESVAPYTLNNMKGQKVNLIFKNQYKFYLGNAVLPSLLLIIICYLVFFYDLDDFQNRIMVSLTALLVLVSLFSQTSDNIPKTAYLKLIDVWFIVLIGFDFFVIVIVVLIEHNRLQNSYQMNKVTTGKFYKYQPTKYLKRALNINKVSKIVFPGIILIFASLFGYIATSNLSHV